MEPLPRSLELRNILTHTTKAWSVLAVFYNQIGADTEFADHPADPKFPREASDWSRWKLNRHNVRTGASINWLVKKSAFHRVGYYDASAVHTVAHPLNYVRRRSLLAFRRENKYPRECIISITKYRNEERGKTDRSTPSLCVYSTGETSRLDTVHVVVCIAAS